MSLNDYIKSYTEYAEYTSAIDSIRSRTSNISISDVYSEVENYNI